MRGWGRGADDVIWYVRYVVPDVLFVMELDTMSCVIGNIIFCPAALVFVLRLFLKKGVK